jgi:hypothetical protein
MLDLLNQKYNQIQIDKLMTGNVFEIDFLFWYLFSYITQFDRFVVFSLN